MLPQCVTGENDVSMCLKLFVKSVKVLTGRYTRQRTSTLVCSFLMLNGTTEKIYTRRRKEYRKYVVDG